MPDSMADVPIRSHDGTRKFLPHGLERMARGEISGFRHDFPSALGHHKDTMGVNHTLDSIAAALVAEGKGILAADEPPATLTKRFKTRPSARRPPAGRRGKISFSYGRALQDPALAHRAWCNGAASLGTYTDEMEAAVARVIYPAHRREWHDD